KVTNRTGATAEGSWTDAVYLSSDSGWSIDDILVAKITHTGSLAVGASYRVDKLVTIPPAKAGSYRLVVRTDIYNEISEDVDERNNTTPSEDALAISVPTLALG